jgi:hypothetical protein
MKVQKYGPHMKRGKKSIGNLKQMTRETKQYEKSCEVRQVVQDRAMWLRTGSSGGM